jgi:hypothetical protein
VNAAVLYLNNGIELLHLRAPPCGIPINGIVAAFFYEIFIILFPLVGRPAPTRRVSLYFLFCLDTKKKQKKSRLRIKRRKIST